MSQVEIYCSHAKTWMTPCIARDGRLALSDPPDSVCVGCGNAPGVLLRDLGLRFPRVERLQLGDPEEAADLLTEQVRAYVEQKGS